MGFSLIDQVFVLNLLIKPIGDNSVGNKIQMVISDNNANKNNKGKH